MGELSTWIKEPASVITGILFGNNLINIVFSSLFTVLVVRVWRVPEKFTEAVSIIFSSLLILTAGEIIPKTFANTHPDRVVRSFYRPFMVFYAASGKLINMLNRVSFALVGDIKNRREKPVSRRELSIAMEEIKKTGVIDDENSKMLSRVLELTKKPVGSVMVPRRSVYAIDINKSYKKIMSLIIKSRHSRIPAYRGKLDNLKGFIYVKDVIGELNKSGKVNFEKIMRPVYETYPGRGCHFLFHELRKRRVHCCIVRSGRQVAGLVSIEDLIEEIVGEIYDEYDFRQSDN